MLNQIFYHSTTRRYVIMFGNMFNDIVVRRFDSSGNRVKSIQVPIGYGPKEKWVATFNSSLQDKEIGTVLPRMGFFFTSIDYDPNRQTNPLNIYAKTSSTDSDTLYTQYAPIPYKLSAELSIFARNADDGMQIVEQIIPFFTPSLTQQINLIPTLDLKLDVKTEMTGITPQQTYEGDFTELRMLTWTCNFVIDGFFFGPIRTNGVIKRVQVDLISVPGHGEVTAEDILNYGRSSRIVVTPGLTANGTPTSNSALSIPYQQIDAEDDYGFVEDVFFYTDGKKYSPRLGRDV